MTPDVGSPLESAFAHIDRFMPSVAEINIRMGVFRGVTAILLVSAPFQAWPAWATARIAGVVYAYSCISLIALGFWQVRRRGSNDTSKRRRTRRQR